MRILNGPAAGREIPLNEDRMSVGRGEKNDIVLPDAGIADLQARIRWMDGRWVILNCTPETRIFVGKVPFDLCKLTPGVRLQVGTTELEFVSLEERAGEMPSSHALVQPGPSAPAVPAERVGGLFPQPAHQPVSGESLPGRPSTGLEPSTRTAAGAPSGTPGSGDETEALPSGLAEPARTPPASPAASGYRRTGSLLFTASILALIIAGTLLLQRVGQRSDRTPVQHVLISEGGEGEIVSVLPYGYDEIGGGGSDPVWQRLVDARPVSPRVMVELVGRGQGSAEIPLSLEGKRVLTLRVIVRGRRARESVFRSDMPLEEVIETGERLIRQGRQLERDRPYDALARCYRPTAEFLEKIEGERPQALASEARRLGLEAEEDLEHRAGDIEQQFWQSFYLKDYARSLRQLERILELTPDEADKRHQRAAILAEVVRQRARGVASR
ncbi:MAG: FHA domain-containing protein [Planctomycetes bacterium]|nr:FHA domain-containing protein [Planctomycetota bacterium]